jgi:hypothetical protein
MDLGRDIFKKIKAELTLVSKVERDTKLEGRRMTLVLQPDHKLPPKPTAAKPAPVGAAVAAAVRPMPAAAPAPATATAG